MTPCVDAFGPQLGPRATNQFWDYGGFLFIFFVLSWWDIHDHCPEKERYDFAFWQLIFSDDFGMPDR